MLKLVHSNLMLFFTLYVNKGYLEVIKEEPTKIIVSNKRHKNIPKGDDI